MRMDSEGAGQWRGGIGKTRRIRNLGEGALLSILGENAIIPPYGVSGGYPAARFVWTILRGKEKLEPSDIPGKARGVPMEYADILEMQSVGGGGYGDPLLRDPELVRQDVLGEYITLERAEKVYGVVLMDGGVDLDKTREFRERLREKRTFIKVIDSAEDDYDKINCRLCRLPMETADRLGVSTGDLVEYVAREGAPLRAWVKVDSGLRGTEGPLGPRGRAILKVRVGEKVEVRALGGLRRKLGE
jgi:N-methylhydantoinase B